MRRIAIELDGVTVEAVLHDEKCPTLCGLFWDALPYESPVIHEMFSGRAFSTLKPLPVPESVWGRFLFPRPGVEDPSCKTNLNPGDVVLAPGGRTSKLCLSYGLAQFREGPAGPSYVNHLASVRKADPNFGQFVEKCAEVYSKGRKTIRFRKA
ncbi:MAG TPA: DUF3830 family protein [Candidatus Sulfotelmatobacter sp.]|nr:DUF3830 family protein [Candidatus Sulfotelmatobacter sp.]